VQFGYHTDYDFILFNLHIVHLLNRNLVHIFPDLPDNLLLRVVEHESSDDKVVFIAGFNCSVIGVDFSVVNFD